MTEARFRAMLERKSDMEPPRVRLYLSGLDTYVHVSIPSRDYAVVYSDAPSKDNAFPLEINRIPYRLWSEIRLDEPVDPRYMRWQTLSRADTWLHTDPTPAASRKVRTDILPAVFAWLTSRQAQKYRTEGALYEARHALSRAQELFERAKVEMEKSRAEAERFRALLVTLEEEQAAHKVHTVGGKPIPPEGVPYGTTHDYDCPACQDTPFTASPRSETYWAS